MEAVYAFVILIVVIDGIARRVWASKQANARRRTATERDALLHPSNYIRDPSVAEITSGQIPTSSGDGSEYLQFWEWTYSPGARSDQPGREGLNGWTFDSLAYGLGPVFHVVQGAPTHGATDAERDVALGLPWEVFCSFGRSRRHANLSLFKSKDSAVAAVQASAIDCSIRAVRGEVPLPD
ncbi:MAG: hypothetical protein Q8M17_01555 [Actinomycetota bacterium]|nr:hypothetical protein [Actinomycetota bacterium]